MKFSKLGLAETGGAAFDHTGDDAADGVAIGLDLCDEVLHLLCLHGIGAAHGVCLRERQVIQVIVAFKSDGAHL